MVKIIVAKLYKLIISASREGQVFFSYNLVVFHMKEWSGGALIVHGQCGWGVRSHVSVQSKQMDS